MILEKIDQTLLERKNQINNSLELTPSSSSSSSSSSSPTSYVVNLYQKGDEAICKKIIEEAGEVIMASKDLVFASQQDNINEAQKHLIYEVADLWFHTMVLLQQHGLNSEMVLSELARREGISGITEKEGRAASN
jgi:phosphoribosyl-ATP pyrophosphohydrolase